MSWNRKPSFVAQPADTPASQIVMRLLVEGEGLAPTPIGTAFWITGHLAATAKHNIEYIIHKFGQPRGRSLIDGSPAIIDYSMRLYQILPGPEYAIWDVDNLTTSTESDIALMHLKLNGYSGPTQPRGGFGLNVCLLPPRHGSKIAALGYHSSRAATKPNPDGGHDINLDDVTQATAGIVTKIFPNGRDRGMYPFPCFQMNARFDSGMSGGPIFDERGRVVGIISGSMPEDGELPAVSYGATLGPIMNIPLSGKASGYPWARTAFPASDRVERGIIKVADLQAYREKQSRSARRAESLQG
ncbi:serine protease [Bosea sp. TWI1241]|uniref:serine protease n=1 Tax=Bosea sp. TWI1241 TaxID=3148904 RepID=UPI00320AEFBE